MREGIKEILREMLNEEFQKLDEQGRIDKTKGLLTFGEYRYLEDKYSEMLEDFIFGRFIQKSVLREYKDLKRKWGRRG